MEADLGAKRVFFPGLPDHDAVDRAVIDWATDHDHVLAVTRCWSQLEEGDETRTRVYCVLIDADGDLDTARRECAEVLRRALGELVGIEILALTEAISQRQALIVGSGVLLWEHP
ncbi:MAG: hypothetical protein ACRDJF_06830 [Actinomycetota bacterium]